MNRSARAAPRFALAITAGALAAGCSRGAPSCEALVAARDWTHAAAVCRDAYEQTHGVAAGIAAARSLLWAGKPADAEQLALALRTTDRAGDAFLVIGEASARRGDAGAAVDAYDQALRVFQRDANDAGASRAALGLAGGWLARGDLVQAMDASQLAIERAERAGDAAMQLYGRLGRSDLLRRQGLLVEAEQELARAAPLARTPRDQAWVALKHGILYSELDLDSLARGSLERALAAPPGSLAPEVALAAHLNLAWIERRAGELARATRHVEAAAAIDADDADVRVNRALILADQERLEDAARELALAAPAAASVRASWWVAYNQGLIAGRRGDLEGMIAAFERSIEGVRALSSHAGSYAPDVAASHRQPYLRLIGAHARRGAWDAALRMVMELDALALLSTERSPAKRRVDPAPGPAAPSSAVALPTVASLLQAWRGRRLVIVVPDEETLWRLEVRDGGVHGAAVGIADELEAKARALETDPTDAAAAEALRAAIVPAGVGAGALDVLLIGAIARAPLAALLHRGRRISDGAPLVRVLGILPRPARPPRSGGSVVLGDPRDDLPSARAEAIAVAARLGVTPGLGAAATSSALQEAHGADLLHVAAHSRIDARGPQLVLADRAVDRADILAARGAPAVVVLASCGSAVARDDTGWGSLAAAYLAAGADAVLASSWTIDDAGTQRFVEELYRHPVREQPARALAAAQARTRAVLPARVWAGFTIIASPPRLSM